MTYIIYSNISIKDFDRLHQRIAKLRAPFEMILSDNKFKISRESDLADILGLDFVSENSRYDGNIGFLFDDALYGYTFTFYVTKSFDENRQRHFKRANVAEHVELEYIENNYAGLLNNALKVYDSFKDEDLNRIIKFE